MSQTQQQLIQNEVAILTNLSCSNIIKLIEVFQQNNITYIVTELCSFGSLDDQMKRKKLLNEPQAIQFLKQMIVALLLLKKNQIVHNDIKPSNIFISHNGYRLADFGFAFKQQTQLQFNLGSPYYMSPESLQDNSHTFQSDIWSLGITLFQITQGQLPFMAINEKELLKSILIKPVLFVKEFSPKFKSLIKSMLELTPSRRVNAETLHQMLFEKENQKPQRLHSMHSEKSPLTMKSNALQICQIAKQLRMMNNENELLAYALHGIILHYSNQSEQHKSPPLMIVDKQKVPNIFSMVQNDLMTFCLSQLKLSIKDLGQYLQQFVNQNTIQEYQNKIIIFINLCNLYQHINQSGEGKQISWISNEFSFDDFSQLIQST